MRPLSKTDSSLLDYLTDGLSNPTFEGSSSRKVDNAHGTYMALSVGRIGSNRYSLAHYFEQNGELISDPDVEFIKDKHGRWFPVAITNNLFGYTRAVSTDKDGNPVKWSPRAYRDLRSFIPSWFRNIKDQQGIKVPRKKSA